ncbi:MAG: SDR family oxidoreductase [Acidimicrobiales bacterium]
MTTTDHHRAADRRASAAAGAARPTDAVTGAFGYTGRFIAERLLAGGRAVRTLTGHPERGDPFGGDVEVQAFRFDDPDALAASLDGVATLYNTYWVRFPRREVGFDTAVANSRALFGAARRAGVERVVHVSITNPSVASRFPYFRGKALAEEALAACGVPWAVVRPTVVFGRGDVLVNNIAWLLRRFPVFAVAGRGRYRLRPVHVGDVARLCLEAATGPEGSVVDAVGPETFTFADLVTAIGDAVGSRSSILAVPPAVVPGLARAIGVVVGDVVLTPDELAAMMAGLVATDGPTTGHVALTEWLAAYGPSLGREYASEIGRHFR